MIRKDRLLPRCTVEKPAGLVHCNEARPAGNRWDLNMSEQDMAGLPACLSDLGIASDATVIDMAGFERQGGDYSAVFTLESPSTPGGWWMVTVEWQDDDGSDRGDD
jgi:hypothetical protein